MNYEKLSPEKFAEKLKGKEYQDLTGARRAIGKASWAEAAKVTARTQAEKFFGVPGNVKAASKKIVAKPAKVAKTAAVKTAKAIAPKKAKRQARQSVQSENVNAGPIPQGFVAPKPLTLADIRKNPFSVIQLAEHCVASGTNVLNTATEMKKLDATVDVAELTSDAVKTIRGGLDLASKVITSLAEGMGNETTAKAINETIANGTVHLPEDIVPQGEPIYTSPTAEA